MSPVADCADECSPWLPVAQQEQDVETAGDSSQQIALRGEAIEAGLLIDVTNMAKGVGLNMAVGITKSLWDRNISESASVSLEGRSGRVRDMLLAVRLRLANLDAFRSEAAVA